MSVIEERNAEILRPQLKLIAQGRSRELDVLPEVGNRDRVSIKTTSAARGTSSHNFAWLAESSVTERRCMGPDSPATVTSRVNLAVAYRSVAPRTSPHVAT
jgi:hypothetical protein